MAVSFNIPGYNFVHLIKDIREVVAKAEGIGVRIVPELFHDMFVGRNYGAGDVTEDEFYLAWVGVNLTRDLETQDEPTYAPLEPVSGFIDV